MKNHRVKYKRILNMRKAQEKMFYMLLCTFCNQCQYVMTPRELINQIGIDEKRAIYMLRKFKNYNWGVSEDMGWIEDVAIKVNSPIFTPKTITVKENNLTW